MHGARMKSTTAMWSCQWMGSLSDSWCAPLVQSLAFAVCMSRAGGRAADSDREHSGAGRDSGAEAERRAGAGPSAQASCQEGPRRPPAGLCVC
eukprot:2064034-Rhodomonas_salina.1